MSSLSHQVDLTGGESVYCINTFQMEKASELYSGDGEASTRLREAVADAEARLTRNERAALAMLLLKRLRNPQ